MTERPLTKRQAEILDYLRSEIDRRGLPPTIREIGEEFGIRSTKGVEDHLAALERKGCIAREKGKSRAIEILDRPDLLLSPRLQDVLDARLRLSVNSARLAISTTPWSRGRGKNVRFFSSGSRARGIAAGWAA